MQTPSIRSGGNYTEPRYSGGMTRGWPNEQPGGSLNDTKEIPQGTKNKKTEQIPGATPNHPIESLSNRQTTSS